MPKSKAPRHKEKAKKKAQRLKNQQMIEARKRMRSERVWSDIESVYAHCVELLSLGQLIDVQLRRDDMTMFVKDADLVKENIDIFIRDSAELSKNLKLIHDQHVGKHGTALSIEEFNTAVEIYQQYAGWTQLAQSTLTVKYTEIMESFHHAELAMQAAIARAKTSAAAEAAAQDPNHVEPIDVEVKA